MKVLIGTPIHIYKDYCMESWIQNVSKLEYPADLLLVDNSPTPDYIEKVKGYCTKYGIKNYKIKYLNLPDDQETHERVARSEEVIRQEILAKDYDAWFCWECDQLIPNDGLGKLVKIMESGNFMMVVHNGWSKETPGEADFGLAVALLKRSVLEKYSFILEFGTDPDMPNSWISAGAPWIEKQIIRDGGNFVHVDGVIRPIYHL